MGQTIRMRDAEKKDANSGRDQSTPNQKCSDIRVPTHERPVQFPRIRRISLAQDVFDKGCPRLGIEDAFPLEPRERIGLEHFSPLVRVIPGGITHRIAEKVVEPAHDGATGWHGRAGVSAPCFCRRTILSPRW